MHSRPDRQMSAAGLARLVRERRGGDGAAYVALADAVRRAVLDGSLPLSTRLPSERELATALGVSRTTTAAAYQRLREQGFIRTRRGSGSVTAAPRGSRAPTGSLVVASDEEHGDDVDLTVAAPSAPVHLHDAALRALEALPHHLGGTGYTFLGLESLRVAIADRYTRRGTPTTPDQVLVTSGAQQAISLVLRTFLGVGERVVVENPTYPNAAAAIRATGARAVPVPVRADGHDLDLLESTVRQVAPRVVHVTPDNHNPTGTSLDDDARARVRDLATRHRTLVLADETLTDLTLDGPAPSPVAGSRPPTGLVVVGSASKTFWGGLRVGWVRADHETVTRLARERAHHDISTPVVDQLVTAELLAVHDAVAAERRAVLRRRRDLLVEEVRARLPWKVETPAGGLSLWVGLGAPVSTALAALAARHGVRVVPGPTFGVDGAFDDRLRLTFTLPEERLRVGVERLAAAWAELAPDDRGAARAHARHARVV